MDTASQTCLYLFESNGTSLVQACIPDELIISINRTNSSRVTDDIGVASDMDQVWVIFCGILVFFMQCGFTLLEAGAVKTANVQNILFKNLMDACCASISWYCFGYCVAYGTGDDGGFIGEKNVFLIESDRTEYISWFFQFAFAATAATIVSGSVAERCTLLAYGCYTIFLTVWVYPVVVHWIWDGEGWLSGFNADPVVKGGVIDFAGSGVVHMVGGFSGLMGAIILGPRIGRFPEVGVNEAADRKAQKLAKELAHQHAVGNNVPFQAMGMFFLWFGWYAFNCGSTLAANGAMNLASKIAVNTTLGAGMGGIGCALIGIKTEGYWSMPRIINGVLAGLVSITAPCATVNPADSLIIGAIGSIVYFGTSGLLERLKVDDPLDAFAVHGACGVWGVLATGIFSEPENIAYAGYSQDLIDATYGYRFSVQLLAVVMIIVWVVGNIGALFFVLKCQGILRIPRAVEQAGLDAVEHGASAVYYPKMQRIENSQTGQNDSDKKLGVIEDEQSQISSQSGAQIITSPDGDQSGAESDDGRTPASQPNVKRIQSNSIKANTDGTGDGGEYHE